MTSVLEKLTSKLPKHLDTVYLVNSGSEANEMALSLARLYTGAWDIVCLRNAYHGITNSNLGLLNMGTYKQQVSWIVVCFHRVGLLYCLRRCLVDLGFMLR